MTMLRPRSLVRSALAPHVALLVALAPLVGGGCGETAPTSEPAATRVSPALGSLPAPSPSGAGEALGEPAAPAPQAGEAMVRGEDGQWRWPSLVTLKPVMLRLWGSSATDVWGVGLNSVTVHWDGVTWRKFPNPGKSTLRAIWGTSSSSVWAVGDDSTILRWNGTAWTSVTAGPIPTAVGLNDVYATSATDVWVVGDDGVILRWDGTDWAALSPPALNSLISVWGSSATNVWIGGDLGMLLRWDGTKLTEVGTGYTDYVTRIRGTTSGKAWMSNSNNEVAAWNGTSWSGMAAYGTDIWVGGESNVWVLNSDRTYLWNGTTWTFKFITPNSALSIWMTGTTDGWIGDSAGNIYRYNGTSWSRRW